MQIKESEITLEANGKPVNAYLAMPANATAAVLVLPSWWGLKPFFKQVCDRLAGEGYAALAPDYYQGRVAHTIEEAQALQGEAEGDLEGMAALVKAAKTYTAELQKGKPIGVVGFSMGTDWAIYTASKDPGIAAVTLFYGSYSVDFSQMKAKVLGHYAEKDQWQPLERVREMEANMKAAGVKVTIHVYAGTEHWFMEEDRPEYEAAAAELAWERTVEFLKKEMG